MLAVFMVLQFGRWQEEWIYAICWRDITESQIPTGTLGFTLMYFLLKSVYFVDSAVI